MTAFIRSIHNFVKIEALKPIDYEMPIFSDDNATGQISFPGTLSTDYVGNWLEMGERLWIIKGIKPCDGMTNVTVADAFNAFYRNHIYPTIYSTVGEFLAAIFTQNYKQQTDTEYAMPYLEITNTDETPIIIPSLISEKLFNACDYLHTVSRRGVKIAIVPSGDLLYITIMTRGTEPLRLTFANGHNDLISQEYSNTSVSKVTAVINGANSYFYLQADGTISQTEPTPRIKGDWITIVTDAGRVQQDVAAAFAQNSESLKVEFYSDREIEHDCPVEMWLNSQWVRAIISSVSISGKDNRYHYKAGSLATTVTDKLRRTSSAAVSTVPGSGGIVQETDPTVPAWAKRPNKPTYTASEVGALPDSTVVGDGEIVIIQGGTEKGRFSVNQTGDDTIELDAGGDLTGAVRYDISQAGYLTADNIKQARNNLEIPGFPVWKGTCSSPSAQMGKTVVVDYPYVSQKALIMPVYGMRLCVKFTYGNTAESTDADEVTITCSGGGTALSSKPVVPAKPGASLALAAGETADFMWDGTQWVMMGTGAGQTPNNGTLTIKQGGEVVTTFSADQAEDEEIELSLGSSIVVTFSGDGAGGITADKDISFVANALYNKLDVFGILGSAGIARKMHVDSYNVVQSGGEIIFKSEVYLIDVIENPGYSEIRWSTRGLTLSTVELADDEFIIVTFTDGPTITADKTLNDVLTAIAGKKAVAAVIGNSASGRWLTLAESDNSAASKYVKFSSGIFMLSVITDPAVLELTWTEQGISFEIIEIESGGGGGTSNHTQLTNRDAADQHPISAITGLQTALDDKIAKSVQAQKTTAMTQAVGIDSDGKLWTAPPGGAPVTRVNGKTGDVILKAEDIQADSGKTASYVWNITAGSTVSGELVLDGNAQTANDVVAAFTSGVKVQISVNDVSSQFDTIGDLRYEIDGDSVSIAFNGKRKNRPARYYLLEGVGDGYVRDCYEALSLSLDGWGYIPSSGELPVQKYLELLDAGKQDKLTAGENITISGNVISASGGGGGSTKEIFAVQITETDGNYSSNKTYAEIKAAFDSGLLPVAFYQDYIYACIDVNYDNDEIAFFSQLRSYIALEIIIDQFLLRGSSVDRYTYTSYSVTPAEKSAWNGKQNALTAGDGLSISGNTISLDLDNYDGGAF